MAGPPEIYKYPSVSLGLIELPRECFASFIIIYKQIDPLAARQITKRYFLIRILTVLPGFQDCIITIPMSTIIHYLLKVNY